MATNRHLTRKQLIRESEKPDTELSSHLRDCEECAEAVRLLRAFKVAGRIPLPEPPPAWVAKAQSIPMSNRQLHQKLQELVARLTFDSWAMPEPVGVRGQATLSQRRISFEAEGVLFDLRAEQHKNEWRFVAQAGAPDRTTGELRTDSRVLLPDQNGIYQWSASRPPKKMSIRIDNTMVMLPEITWTRPSSKKRPSSS